MVFLFCMLHKNMVVSLKKLIPSKKSVKNKTQVIKNKALSVKEKLVKHKKKIIAGAIGTTALAGGLGIYKKRKKRTSPDTLDLLLISRALKALENPEKVKKYKYKTVPGTTPYIYKIVSI